jgi:hypothetical protein
MKKLKKYKNQSFRIGFLNMVLPFFKGGATYISLLLFKKEMIMEI